MTDSDADDAIARAVREIRSAPEESNWIDISSSIISKISKTGRRSWPIDATFTAGAPDRSDDTLRIGDRLVRTALRRAVDGVHRCEVTAVDLYLDDHTCTGASVTVTGIYGDDLRAVGAELARTAAGALDDILGPAAAGRTIDITIDDIHTGQHRI
ncbi:hypothetical protein [Antrihabitans cavernicola]|uniref:Asp23/Gls24 family envelope stress response protein n=1 Tax=Antrihabitans cavernicola TaxID=2495913 RepID=A0A5A7SHU0_9NOCA|nr:hypothetical protein [Spelaeibacter cavernicola]KAA0024732.1 hypothetical protein FOY51_01995 [Spelaeibacter cavernicola]